jgi:hypothetical protein
MTDQPRGPAAARAGCLVGRVVVVAGVADRGAVRGSAGHRPVGLPAGASLGAAGFVAAATAPHLVAHLGQGDRALAQRARRRHHPGDTVLDQRGDELVESGGAVRGLASQPSRVGRQLVSHVPLLPPARQHSCHQLGQLLSIRCRVQPGDAVHQDRGVVDGVVAGCALAAEPAAGPIVPADHRVLPAPSADRAAESARCTRIADPHGSVDIRQRLLPSTMAAPRQHHTLRASLLQGPDQMLNQWRPGRMPRAQQVRIIVQRLGQSPAHRHRSGDLVDRGDHLRDGQVGLHPGDHIQNHRQRIGHHLGADPRVFRTTHYEPSERTTRARVGRNAPTVPISRAGSPAARRRRADAVATGSISSSILQSRMSISATNVFQAQPLWPLDDQAVHLAGRQLDVAFGQQRPQIAGGVHAAAGHQRAQVPAGSPAGRSSGPLLIVGVCLVQCLAQHGVHEVAADR